MNEQQHSAPSEDRLEAIRERAHREGTAPGLPEIFSRPPGPGYHGQPMLKPPVWTWEVPLYFFLGGIAGMSGVIAFAVLGRGLPLLRLSLALAIIGSFLSAILLTLDLGRPSRFLMMLRVFKRRSPMSVGAWVLFVYGNLAVICWLMVEWIVSVGLRVSDLVGYLVTGAFLVLAVLGAILGTYTGVLLAATAVPVWAAHRRILPLHFGVAGLGSAAAILELGVMAYVGEAGLVFRPLWVICVVASIVETLIGAEVEVRRLGPVDRALRTGRSGLLLRLGGLLCGPVSLGFRLLGWLPVAAGAFLVGAVANRYGWLEAGKSSALDPEAAAAAAGWKPPRT